MAEGDGVLFLPFEVVYDEESRAVKAIVFKDTVTGKKYKLQITNGEIELIEVS